jgi:hypothetical protein
MAAVTDFEHIRAGGMWPNCVDIWPLDCHSSDGIAVVASTYREAGRPGYLQFVRHGREVALLIHRYDAPTPEKWLEHEVIWDSRGVPEETLQSAPDALAEKSGGYWADGPPEHPVEDWKLQVRDGDTRMSYWEWVCSRMEDK